MSNWKENKPATRSRSGGNLHREGFIPPQSTKEEQAVLGACLLHGSAIHEVADMLVDGHFYKESHRMIYQAICEMSSANIPVDILSVKDHLDRTGQLEIVGGVYYLTELTSKVASSANIRYHASLVVGTWALREQLRIAQEIIADVRDKEFPQAIAEKASKALEASTEFSIQQMPSMEQMAFNAVKDLEQLEKRRIEALSKGESFAAGLSTGYFALDNLTTGFYPGDLIILAARPSMGKTALAQGLTQGMLRSGAVLFFSLEQDSAQIVMRMISMTSGVPLKNLRTGNLGDGSDQVKENWISVRDATESLGKQPLSIDDGASTTVNQMRAKAWKIKSQRKRARQADLVAIVIDYLQLMSLASSNKQKSGNREQEVSEISRSLKMMAKALQLPVIALSQLSRAVETRGGDKRPILSDLRESGSIEQDADTVMFLYRPEYYGLKEYGNGSSTEGMAEVIIAKQRSGPTGTALLRFNPECTHFTNIHTPKTTPIYQPQFEFDDDNPF